MIESLELLKTGEYYRINGTKKILYWDGFEFKKPIKDSRKRYSGWIHPLERQPKFRFAELITEDLNMLL